MTLLQPGAAGSIIDSVAGFGTAFGQMAVMLLLRLLGRGGDPYVTLFYFSLVSTLLLAPALLFLSNTFSPESAFYLFSTGLSALLGQIALARAVFFMPSRSTEGGNIRNLPANRKMVTAGYNYRNSSGWR